ncbi:MAG: VRR-NUC domain-containing protein [Candidatus Saccharibacteria bacterium]|nr:VRR-NUC domain-containing protein [Candidatus Saccharibacteria bacterium]
MATYKTIPTEDEEQVALFDWLDAKHIPAFHVNNEMYTKSWKQKSRAKRMGVRSGVPDVFAVLPTKVVAIELKRTKGGVVSDNQKYWIKTLNDAGLKSIVARGASEAIAFIETEIKNERTKYGK